MSNPPKTLCFYHKDELITNFCRDKNCLMPLCPMCIGEHSQHHYEHLGSKPQYASVYQILSDVESLLYNSIVSLEKDRVRIAELTKSINSLDSYIHQTLANAKLMVFNVVEETFKELEVKVANKISALHQETGLHSIHKTQKYEQELADKIGQLYEMNQGLKGTKFLGHVILFMKEKEKECSSLHSLLSTFLEQNETYSPKVEVTNEGITSISHCLHRLFRVEGKKDIDKRKEREREDQSTTFGRKNAKDYYQKNQKIERSYTPRRSAMYTQGHRQPHQQAQSKVMLPNNHSPYVPKSISPENEPTVHRSYNQPTPTVNLSQFNASSNPPESSRVRDFKQEYEVLSRKVTKMRRENEIVSRRS